MALVNERAVSFFQCIECFGLVSDHPWGQQKKKFPQAHAPEERQGKEKMEGSERIDEIFVQLATAKAARPRGRKARCEGDAENSNAA